MTPVTAQVTSSGRAGVDQRGTIHATQWNATLGVEIAGDPDLVKEVAARVGGELTTLVRREVARVVAEVNAAANDRLERKQMVADSVLAKASDSDRPLLLEMLGNGQHDVEVTQ